MKLKKVKETKKFFRFIILFLILCFTLNSYATTSDKVKTFKDEKGWKLKVNGEDYFVKGVVWGYTPIGENYSYNLWGHTDDFIQKVLDYECNLMKNAEINTIRSFGLIPPKWVTYIYEKHGIMSIMNHLMGRYGYNIGGVWKAQTNYSDELTRTTLKNDVVEMVKKYKDTPGVLMFALGNESNYGLEWSSFEIENLPEGEQHKEKAKSLYTLYNEIIVAGKKVDSTHLYTIVNGDIQYLDLIVEHCKDLDVLGVNSYRGISFTGMWKDVYDKLGLPIMLTEFGSDAFNAKENREDQSGQAYLIKGNWKEIYNKSYDKGEEGNSIGGCLFEWRDEWWKYKQTENLTIQDKNASWSNGGYNFDYVKGLNNMNEEWFGICRLTGPDSEGIYGAEPRMIYDVMSEIWSMDLYNLSKKVMNQKIDNINMQVHNLSGDLRLLKSDKKKRDAFSFTGGSLMGDLAFNGKSYAVENEGKDGVEFSNGEMLMLKFAFQPTDKIKGNFTLNILGNVVDKQMEQYYGKRGVSYTNVVSELNPEGLVVTTEKEVTDNERIEIYDFEASYSTMNFDLSTFYHVPRYHWGYKGDFYGLLNEATDMEGMDIWNAKAPYGFEFKGKEFMNGLTIVVGPEIYWGANPKAIVKYDFNFSNYYFTMMHAEDFARAKASSTATESTQRSTRQSTLYMKTGVIPRTTVELGYLFAGSEKIDEEYYYVDDDVVYKDEIEIKDTQGIKAKITVEAFAGTKVDATVNYSGLVADGGNQLREFDTTMPYSGLGNKIEFEGGLLIPVGNFWFLPRGLYRKNLLKSNPSIEPSTNGPILNPGLTPRNRDNDPFAVLDNREAISGEFFITYDPTPASFFYAWDNEKREDAKFACSIGGNFTSYKTETDANLFFYQEGNTNAPFGSGLESADVWLAKGKFIMNPTENLKVITNLELGEQQSTGNPDGGSKEFYSLSTKFIVNNKHYISGYAKKDAWGPYDWYRQFNITYPYQFMLDYSILIDNILDDVLSSRLGVKALYRTLDENVPGNEWDDGNNDYMFQFGAYYKIEF